MNHLERMLACVNKTKVDRPPLALWRHFPVADQDPLNLAKATLDFQSRFDFDLIKVSPSSSYCITDWKAQDEWQGNPEGTREYIHHPVAFPDDWINLKPLDPNSGFLAKIIEALNHIQAENSSHAPIIQTIFNPLSQAKNLAGKENLLLHMRKYPEALKTGLETITETSLDYLSTLHKMKLDGIFFAIQHAQYTLATDLEFSEFCKSYDLKILDACRDFSFRLLHIHGKNVMFNQVIDYPVNLINWHDRESEFSLNTGKQLSNSAVCGGISLDTITLGSPDQVISEVIEVWEDSDQTGICFGTGCVMPVITPDVNIYAACKAVETLIL